IGKTETDCCLQQTPQTGLCRYKTGHTLSAKLLLCKTFKIYLVFLTVRVCRRSVYDRRCFVICTSGI
ncbi:MAG TPA: hypothetical protein VFL47_05100, partial [Flavisolibacter sp.]|nr:hypothetical protein [Flavisolibacter sp.]